MNWRLKTALAGTVCILFISYIGNHFYDFHSALDMERDMIRDSILEKKGPRGSTNGSSEQSRLATTHELSGYQTGWFRDNVTLTRSSNIPDDHGEYVINEEKCRIKNYDHNNSEVLKIYFESELTWCPADAKPFIFYPLMNLTTGHSCVGFNDTVFKEWYADDFEKWSCTYSEVTRDLNHEIIDMHFEFGRQKKLGVGDCPTEEFIWIECIRPRKYGFLSQLFSLGPPKYEQPLMLPVVKNVAASTTGKDRLHVLVLGLDSVSRLNAHRLLPQTLKYLQSKEYLIELFGYNKIGMNSIPNQVPLLSGVFFSEIFSRVGSNYFDNMTRYLWDDYAEQGFRTMYLEEKYDWGLFVYPNMKGFLKVPTTYWPRPIIQAIEDSSLKKEGADLCIGPDFAAKHYLDYTYNTLKILGKRRPLFAYQFLVETSHNELNGGKRLDKYFLQFFKNMEDGGVLNNTAVFFISDHGFRFGEFRKTEQGRYEDMLPFGFVLLPDRYYKDKPEALKNMGPNSRRLVTVFDLHATLLELTDPWNKSRVFRTTHGYSLLSNVISSRRSCEDAGISFQYCTCFEHQPLDTKSNLSLALAEFVIETINSVILKNGALKRCSEWSLDSVHGFVRLSEGNEWTDFYKATIRTTPPAQFEVAAQYRKTERNWTLLSEIDRTDWFSTNSYCAKDESFERYCYCR